MKLQLCAVALNLQARAGNKADATAPIIAKAVNEAAALRCSFGPAGGEVALGCTNGQTGTSRGGLGCIDEQIKMCLGSAMSCLGTVGTVA